MTKAGVTDISVESFKANEIIIPGKPDGKTFREDAVRIEYDQKTYTIDSDDLFLRGTTSIPDELGIHLKIGRPDPIIPPPLAEETMECTP